MRSSSRELRKFIPAQMEVHACLCSLNKLPQIDLGRMNNFPKRVGRRDNFPKRVGRRDNFPKRVGRRDNFPKRVGRRDNFPKLE
jgi:hypothetical protein